VLQRLSLDGVEHPVDLYFPASGQEYVDRLRRACAAHVTVEVREHPVSHDGLVDTWPGLELHAATLDHRVETYGWRLQEPEGRRMLPERLAARGIDGPDVGRIVREGALEVDGGVVHVEEVSEVRPGQSFAFVMDTRHCPAAVELARGVDLLMCESTYLTAEEQLAESYAHLTAAQAAGVAADAGARRLVLTHYSQRHSVEAMFADEARALFPDVHAARDLDRIALPPRRA
jgi:ribonuclease Z